MKWALSRLRLIVVAGVVATCAALPVRGDYLAFDIATHEATADFVPFESREWAAGLDGEGGRLAASATWAGGEHVILNDLYVSRGATLTIDAGTVVRFCEGTRIKVEDGGKIVLNGELGNEVVLEGYEDGTSFKGIELQSSSAGYSDNCYVVLRGAAFAMFATVSIKDTEAFMGGGQALVPVKVSGSRDTAFSFDWVAETNGVQFAGGTMNWNSVSDGTKNIVVPYPDGLPGCSNFTVRATTLRCCTASKDACNVNLSEFVTAQIHTHEAMADFVPFESREWAEGLDGEGGRLAASATWAGGEHVILNDLYVSRGATLTIDAGTVVRFCEGTRIKVEDGGKLNIVGAEGQDVIFRAADGVTNFVGVVVMPNGTYTDNMYVQYLDKPYAAYPYVKLREATTYREAGTLYIPVTLSGESRDQTFNIDWMTDKGDAGTLTWSSSSDGTKWIQIPVDATSVGGTTNHLITITAARGCNISVGEATLTILEPDYIVKGMVTLNESDEDSGEFAVNGDIKTQPLFLKPVETVYYSGKWQNYDTNKASTLRVTIETDNGKEILKEALPSETGSFDLDLAKCPVGCYTLKHDILDEVGETLATMQKTFSIADDEDVVMHGGTLTQNETWEAGKVHVVYQTVVVPSIYTIFIEPGAIVKFMTGTGIDISKGGAFFANGIVFTHINDDTVGGDTLNDGYTVAPPMDAYFLSGNFTFGDDTELRGITQNTALTGTISSQKMLSRGSTYRVSGTLTIASGGVLTIPPGTVLKMETGASIVVNSGATLNAIGTRAAPIVFTSIKDDEYSGDTNNDGNATYPQPGDWRQIKVSGGTFNAAHLSMFYLSNDNNQGGLYVTGGEANMDCCVIAHCKYDCMRSTGGKSVARNCVFADASIGVAPNGGAAEYSNCVFNGLTTAVRWPSGTFVNCVFSDVATSFFESTGSSPIRNCVLWNAAGYGPQSVSVVGKNGNVWADPLFIDAEKGDYRVLEGSPCVDAADNTVAPELDFFGQPRVTITDGGSETNLVGQLADIGICEVMPRDIVSDIDLVPQSVRTTTNAVPGQLLFVKWEIANVGGREVEAAWRDTVSLVSESGREVVIGDKITSSRIGVGGSVFCSGYFTVPAIDEGTWYPKVNVNSYHDIFEGSLVANNALVGERAVIVGLEALDPSTSHEGVINAGIPTVLKFAFSEDNSNRMVAFDVPAGVTATWGFGFMPGGTRSRASASGSAVSSNDSVFFRVPDDAIEVYVVLESDTTTTYNLTTESTQMVITGVTPERVSNKSTSTLEIFGAGLSGISEPVLRLNGKEVVGEIIEGDDERLLVKVAFNGAVAGVWRLLLKDGSGEEISAGDVTVFANARGADVKVEIETPESYRPGRWNVARVSYRNDGDEETTVPLIKLTSEAATFKSPDGDDALYEHSICLIGLVDTATPTVMRPGEFGEIIVQFCVTNTSSYYIGVNECVPGVDLVPLDRLYALDGKSEEARAEFAAKMKDAFGADDASGPYGFLLSDALVCARYGRMIYCAAPFLTAAADKANGEQRSIVSATLIDEGGWPVADAKLFSVSANRLKSHLGTTSADGRIVFYDVGDGFSLGYCGEGGWVETATAATNSPVTEVVLTLKHKEEEPPEEERASLFPEVLAGATREMKFMRAPAGALTVGWVDENGLFNVGRIDGGGLNPWIAEDLEMDVRDWRVQKEEEGSLLLFVHGILEGKSKIVLLRIACAAEPFSVVSKGTHVLPCEVTSPIWDGERNLIYLDECGRIVKGTNVVISMSSAAPVSRRKLASASWFDTTGAWTVDISAAGFSLKGSLGMHDYRPQPIKCCQWIEDMGAEGKVSFKTPWWCPVYGLHYFELGLDANGKVTRGCGGHCGGEDPKDVLYGTLHYGGKASVGQTAQIGGYVKGINNQIQPFLDKVADLIQVKGEYALAGKVRSLLSSAGGNLSLSANITAGAYAWNEEEYIRSDMARREWEIGGEAQGSVAMSASVSLTGGDWEPVSGWRISLGKDIIEGAITVKAGYNNIKSLVSRYELNLSLLGGVAKGKLGGTVSWSGGFEPDGEWEIRLNDAKYHGADYENSDGTVTEVNSYTDGNGDDLKNSDLAPIPGSGISYTTPDVGEDGANLGTGTGTVRDEAGNVYNWSLSDLHFETEFLTVSDGEFWAGAVAKDPNTTEYALYEVSFDKMSGKTSSVRISDAGNLREMKISEIGGNRIAVTRSAKSDGRSTIHLHRRMISRSTWDESVVLTNIENKVEIVDVTTNGNAVVVLAKNTADDEAQSLFTMEVVDGAVVATAPLALMTPQASVAVRSSESHLATGSGNSSFMETALQGGKKILMSVSSPNYPTDGCDFDCSCGCGPKRCFCPPSCEKCKGDCVECHCGRGGGGKGRISCDPNEMSGPLGLGDPETERFVKPGEELTYTIYFENVSNATAAAQEVYVTNSLSQYLDWSTFKMGEVVFGDQIDLGLVDKQSGSSEATMKGTNFVVRTKLVLEENGDAGTRDACPYQAKWYMRIVDPTTDTGWPKDIVAGFLPPNDETHRGEGHLTYSICVREDAPANLVISNSADIVFDHNPVIKTDPAWWNTVAPEVGEVRFAEADVVADEGSNVVVRVYGGDAYTNSSVKVYLTWNTAGTADVDLKIGTVADARDARPYQANLKFPLTLSWVAGEVGEKVITIPVKADKTVEDDEFFTLQLAEPVGMELGEECVCTVTIHDPGYDALAAKIEAGTATKTEQTAWDKLQKAKAPYIRGLADTAERGKVTGSGLCPVGKKVTLKATANKGFVFVGWNEEGGHAGRVTLPGDDDGHAGRVTLPGDDDGHAGRVTLPFIATTPTLVIDRTAKPAKDSATSTTITNVTSDATYYACFITADEDKDSIRLAVNGEEMDAAVSSKPPYQTNIWAGVYLEWPVAVEALSAPTVKVAGLPAGLKFTAKPVTAKVGTGKEAVVVTNVPANAIYGAPTAASKTTVDKKTGATTVTPSAVKVTVTTAGKSSQTFPIDLYVDPLPAWAVGNFDGYVAGTQDASPYQGLVAMTVAANGKISGKMLEDGKTWTMSAASFDFAGARPQQGGDAVGSHVPCDLVEFHATVIGKAGKEVVTNEVEVASAVVDGVEVGVASSDGWAACQNLWKRTDTKAAMPIFKKSFDRVLELGEPGDANNTVKLTFKKDGVVSFAGKVDGTSVSGSSQLACGGDGHAGRVTLPDAWQVTLYAPPKETAKPPFAGWCETLSVTLETDDQNVVTDVGL